MASSPSGHDVFISYSHAADRPVAIALQHGLHRLAKRWFQVRALRVFRDDTSLAANPHLWTAIEAGLRGSRFFLLVASREAASSEWVGKEVEFRRRWSSPGSFLIVVTDGDVAWNRATGDFDWEVTTALPRQLSGWFADEPLWVRLDGARRGVRLSLRNAVFRAVVCKVASPVHGVPPDDLDSVDIVRHRVANRLRVAAVVALVVLLAVSAVLGVFALRQRDEAVRQATAATVRAFAAEADALAGRDPVLSARLALAAYRLDPAAEQARSGVLRALDRNRHHVRRVVQERALTPGGQGKRDDVGLAGTVALSPDGAVLAVGTKWTGEVRLWEVGSGRELGSLGEAPNDSDRFGPALRFGDDGTTLSVIGTRTTSVWDVAKRERLSTGPTTSSDHAPGSTTAVSRDGRSTVRGDDNGRLSLLDAGSTPVEVLAELPDVVTGVAVSDDGSVAAAVDAHGNVLTLRTRDDLRFDVLSGPTAGVAAPPQLLPSPDGRRLLVVRAGMVELWRLDERVQVGSFPTSEQLFGGPFAPPVAEFSPDGGRFAVRSGGEVVVRDSESFHVLGSEPASGDPVDVARAFTGQVGGAVAVVDAAGALTAVLPDRTVRVSEDIGAGLVGTPPGRSGAVLVSADDGGGRLKSWTSSGASDLAFVGESRVETAAGAIAVSDDGRFVALDDSVVDMTTGHRTPLLGGSGSGVAGHVLAFAAHGDVVLQQLLPSRDYSGGTRLLVWDRGAGALIGEFDDHSLLPVNPFEIASGVVGVGPGSAVVVRQDGAILVLGVEPDGWARSLCGLVGDFEPDERRDRLGGVELGPIC
ncbi:MAG TPA: TIR domain-containing protein [Umezawaea sp.]|nr:TIR domain-containing protein [Umezawaea sp.]